MAWPRSPGDPATISLALSLLLAFTSWTQGDFVHMWEAVQVGTASLFLALYLYLDKQVCLRIGVENVLVLRR